MTIHSTPMRLIAASLLATTVSGWALPAMALDADDFASKVAALVGQGGARLSFSAIEADGDTIVLTTARMEAQGEEPVELGDITFEGVEDGDNGSYYVERASFEDVDNTRDGVRVTVADLELAGLTIPARVDEDPVDTLSFYEGFSTGRIAVEKDGAEVFSMAETNLDVERADDDSSVSMKMDGSGIEIDLSQIEDAKARDALSELGYTKLNGDLKFDGVWKPDEGTLALQEYSLDLDDVGRLAVSLEISGYTREFIQGLQQAQAAAAANPDPQAAQQAMGFAMLGMMQQLSFNSATIQFVDDSATEKALAYAGRQQGISGDQMGQSIKIMLPIMLGGLGIPALQQQISAAANVYLDNPQTLTITARPASPVAAPVIMGASMGDPRTLVDLLNVQITANEPVRVCCE